MGPDRVAIPPEMVALLNEPWAIRPAVLQTFIGWVRDGGVPISALRHEIEAAGDSRRHTVASDGSAIIAVRGPISRRPTALSFLCGGASTEDIAGQLNAALADPSVQRIVLDIDSPGGTVDGVPELADAVFNARSKKPVSALVDTTAASAAYWIASQASEVIATPSSELGSIGVFGLHLDYSQAMEQAGVRATFIKAGRFKTEGNPYEPLSDEAKAHFQEGVDAFYGMFTRDVARGRGVSVETVRGASFGEGRVLLARQAVAAGLADRIGTAATIGLSRTSGSQTRLDRDRAESDWLRLRHTRRDGGSTAVAVGR